MQYWTHQQRGIEFVRDKAGSLLWYGMGSGKTLTSIGIMRDQEAQLILISCPKPVVRTWISEFEKHTNNEFDIIAPLTGSVEKKTKEIEKQLKYFGKNKKPKVVIVNYESIWRPGMGPVYDKFKNLTSTGFIRGQDWDLVFVDECFVKDTLIDTPMGSVKIQDLKIGDFVYGYDHDVEKVIPTKIREIIVNTVPSRNLCGFNGLTTTMGHPFFVEDNYKMAGLIDPENDFLWKRNEYGNLERTKVSGLWRAVDGEAKQKMVTRQKKKSGKKWSFLLSSMLFKMGKEQSRNDGTIIKNLGNKTWKNPKTKVFDMQQTTDNKTDTISFEEEKGIKKRRYEIFLREILLCNMENGSTRNKSKNIYKGDERESFFEIKGSMDTKSRDKKNCRSKGKLSRESLCEKQNRKCSESPRKIKETWIQIFKRREWPWFYDCPGFIIKFVKKTISRIFLGNRTCVYELSSGISERPPLPNRYSKSDFKVGDRGRWSISPISACCSEGQKKNKNLESKWLDSDEIQEQRNYIESTKSIMVYNIETETNNYFADGILNHNCQKLKSAGSKVSMFFKALRPKTKKRIGLSGTPTPNSPLDIYGIYRFLDPDIFGTSYQRFQMKYALMGGFENYTVLKIINQQELNQKVYSIADRVETEDVIELPDCSDIYVDCELSPKARKAYDEFYKEAILEFSSGTELTAANVLVKQLRLAQITSGTVLDDDGHEHVIDTAKLDTLEELILGMDEPCVIFTRFRSEVKQIRAMIESFKQKGEKPRTVCQIASGIDERDLFASGKADICVVNIQSGGVGLNELVRARYAFYYSTGYSSGDFEQSKARIRRPGSDLTKKVLYYHIIAKNTMDEVIKKSIDKKLNIIQTVLQDFSKNLCKKAA